MGLFLITIVIENLANRGESSRISVNSCPRRTSNRTKVPTIVVT